MKLKKFKNAEEGLQFMKYLNDRNIDIWKFKLYESPKVYQKIWNFLLSDFRKSVKKSKKYILK
jgi:hypothetical protein